MQFIIPIISLGSPYLGWNILIDGRPHPDTFYAKASPRLGANPGDLMPARMRPIKKNVLEVILIKRTAGYRVTSNPLMGRQFIAVGLAKTGQLIKEFDLSILSRTIRVCLKGFDVEVIDRLKASLE